MKLEKQDRRSRRTRHLVQSALMELLLEKRYEAITVRDILDRAGIGSSTFYAHYFDKEDVTNGSDRADAWAAFKADFSEHGQAGSSSQPGAVSTYSRSIPSTFKRSCEAHAEEKVWKVAQTTLSRTIEQALASTYAEKRSPSVPLAVVAQYLAGAFLSLLKWWIETEMPYSPERMDEIFQQLGSAWGLDNHRGKERINAHGMRTISVAHPVGRSNPRA